MKRKGILLLAITITAILVIANYQSIFKSVLPPSPEIVTSRANGSSSSLFDYSMKVMGEVTNKGGDGYIIVKAFAEQEGEIYEKTQQFYMTSYQSEPFEFIFDEVKFLKEEPTYRVETFALGDFGE